MSRGKLTETHDAGNNLTFSAEGMTGVALPHHMLVTAVAEIPVSFAAARWGRRGFVLGGTALGMVSSFFIPIFDSVAALAVIYAAAGLAFAAFTPSTMSLTADAAAPGHVGRA